MAFRARKRHVSEARVDAWEKRAARADMSTCKRVNEGVKLQGYLDEAPKGKKQKPRMPNIPNLVENRR